MTTVMTSYLLVRLTHGTPRDEDDSLTTVGTTLPVWSVERDLIVKSTPYRDKTLGSWVSRRKTGPRFSSSLNPLVRGSVWGPYYSGGDDTLPQYSSDVWDVDVRKQRGRLSQVGRDPRPGVVSTRQGWDHKTTPGPLVG